MTKICQDVLCKLHVALKCSKEKLQIWTSAASHSRYKTSTVVQCSQPSCHLCSDPLLWEFCTCGKSIQGLFFLVLAICVSQAAVENPLLPFPGEILSVGKFMEMLGIYLYIYITSSGMCELELFWCQATFASDFRTFCDVIPHDSRWFLSVLSQSSIPAPPPFRAAAAPAPSWCAWQAEMVELSNCGTLWNIVKLFLSSRKPRMPMVCHLCQWSFQGFGYKQIEMVSFSFGCSCLHTDHRFEKKTMCIASLLPSEHISWYLWHFPSSTRPTWEYDFNWHRWRPLILTRDLKSNDVAETWTLRQTRILRIT